jgi:hypothetical protein
VAQYHARLKIKEYVTWKVACQTHYAAVFERRFSAAHATDIARNAGIEFAFSLTLTEEILVHADSRMH